MTEEDCRTARRERLPISINRGLGAAVAVMATGALTACGAGVAVQASSGSDPVRASLTALDGRRVEVPGAVPTAMFFFAVDCGECAGGMTSVAQAQAATQKSGGKGAFLAVDMYSSESTPTITDFLHRVQATTLPVVIDKEATLAGRYQVAALSTLIVVAADGTVTYRATDPPTDQITAAVEKAGAK